MKLNKHIMKTIVCTAAFFFSGLMLVQAQENKEVNEKTTVKKVTTKDTKVETLVVKETETEKGTLTVEGNEKEDQQTVVKLDKTDDVRVIANEVTLDENNSKLREQNLKNKEIQLEASKQAEMDKAAREKQIIEENKKQMLDAMEERRKALESRPKGMAKLKIDN
jgi:hypothetical protein